MLLKNITDLCFHKKVCSITCIIYICVCVCDKNFICTLLPVKDEIIETLKYKCSLNKRGVL